MEKVTQVRQYARALFELALEAGVVDRVASELETIAGQIAAQVDVHEFLFHPEVPLEAKRAVLARFIPPDATTETGAFLKLLVQHRHLQLLTDVVRAYLALRQASFGLLKAEVETVRPLSRELKEHLQATLARVTGHGVVIEEKLNPELLGGMRVRIGDRIVDASVAGRLDRIRERLLRSGLPAQAST